MNEPQPIHQALQTIDDINAFIQALRASQLFSTMTEKMEFKPRPSSRLTSFHQFRSVSAIVRLDDFFQALLELHCDNERWFSLK